MSYSVGQKIWTEGYDSKNIFMMPAEGNFIASRINSGIDQNLGSATDIEGFNDECLLAINNTKFQANTTYYFHGRIMRMPASQTFNIQLRNNNENDTTMQFIKKIVVAKKESEEYNEWVDVHFLFTPIIDSFDTLAFILTRNAMAGDFNPSTVRFPSIIYEELSTVKNYISDGSVFTKVGVQTHPGLEICINGEEIIVGRSGIYELKNDLVSVNSFSVISTAEELDKTIYPGKDENDWDKEIEIKGGLEKAEYDLAKKYWGWDIDYRIKEEENKPLPDLEVIEVLKKMPKAIWNKEEGTVNGTAWRELKNDISPTSEARISIEKQRYIDSFILDYMYKS